MKILAWNIRQGGGSRSVDIATAILSHQSDMVILSEYRNNKSGHYIRTKLLTTGYCYQYASHHSSLKNGVLIASRLPADFCSYPSEIDDFPESIGVATVKNVKIWGLYLPHKKKHNLFDFLFSKLEPNYEHILIGDFNTGKNYIDQKGGSFWYSDELLKLEKMGFRDAYRYFHGDKREFSWFSHQGNGYRYDHCYVSSAIIANLKSCDFSHAEREENLSDHSLMILTINLLPH